MLDNGHKNGFTQDIKLLSHFEGWWLLCRPRSEKHGLDNVQSFCSVSQESQWALLFFLIRWSEGGHVTQIFFCFKWGKAFSSHEQYDSRDGNVCQSVHHFITTDQTEVSPETIGWIAMKPFTVIHCPQKISPLILVRLTFLVSRLPALRCQNINGSISTRWIGTHFSCLCSPEDEFK